MDQINTEAAAATNDRSNNNLILKSFYKDLS
jgi:hypothetical protein